MELFKTVVEMLTPILAMYGAILATVVAVNRLRSDRLSAFVSHGWSYSQDSLMNSAPPKHLFLHAVNNGRRDLVVSSLTLDIPGCCRIAPGFLDQFGATNIGYDDVEGRRLSVGDRIQVQFDNLALRSMIQRLPVQPPVRVRAVLEDTLENYFFSSWFEIRDQ